MNWTNFQTYGMAPDKAFEVLCNQLFENWSKEEYKSDIASIRVVNGAGGDGGVESYAFILEMGWNEQEFYNFNEDESGEGIVGGVDCSIRGTHHSATHGSQSSVMTVCEKYVWQARNEISGFLCDRLLFGDENVPVTDYGLLDDFVIPIQEARIINPDNIPDDRPWHIPEPEKAVLEGTPSNAKDVITKV